MGMEPFYIWVIECQNQIYAKFMFMYKNNQLSNMKEINICMYHVSKHMESGMVVKTNIAIQRE